MALPKEVQQRVMIDAETNVSEVDMKENNDSLDKRPLDNGDVRCKFDKDVLLFQILFKLTNRQKW